MFNQKGFNPWKLFIIVLLSLAFLRLAFILLHPKNSSQIVRSVRVERGNLTITITATGEVKPQNRVEVKPPIGGRLEEVLIKEGDMVKKGQTLAWMSSSERAALLDAATSRGPEVLKEWQEVFKPAPVISPIDGTVIVQTLEGGQTVTVSDPVAVISDRLIVKAQVDETDLSKIKLGQETEIQLDAYAAQKIPGTVDHIYYESTLVNNVNVYYVDVLPKEMPSMFRSGMTATVTFVVLRKEKVFLLPAEAITSWPEEIQKPKNAEFAVYIKSFGGKLTPIPVRIGDSDGRMVEILEGVKENQAIQIVRRKEASAGKNPFLPRRPESKQQKKEKMP